MTIRPAISVALAAIVVAGCGDDGSDAAVESAADEGSQPTTVDTEAAPGSGPTASDDVIVPAPSIVSPADDGSVFAMEIGDVVDFVVGDPFAPDPRVIGTSIEVVEVVNIDGSGGRQWELRAIDIGPTAISSDGSPSYSLTFIVSD